MDDWDDARWRAVVRRDRFETADASGAARRRAAGVGGLPPGRHHAARRSRRVCSRRRSADRRSTSRCTPATARRAARPRAGDTAEGLIVALAETVRTDAGKPLGYAPQRAQAGRPPCPRSRCTAIGLTCTSGPASTALNVRACDSTTNRVFEPVPWSRSSTSAIGRDPLRRGARAGGRVRVLRRAPEL